MVIAMLTNPLVVNFKRMWPLPEGESRVPYDNGAELLMRREP
jgi:hypothetical protein